MRLTYICPACHAKVVAPASLEGESLPCPRCHADVDRWPAPTGPSGLVRVANQPPPLEPAVWFYLVGDARRGPATFPQIRALTETGVVRPTDVLWREGLPEWVTASTVPGLFPTVVSAPPAPPPPRRATRRRDEEDEYDDEDRRPRRPRRDGFRCPYCGSHRRPFVQQQVSPAGWVVFTLLLIFTIVFCFIGLFIKEDVRRCSDCGARL